MTNRISGYELKFDMTQNTKLWTSNDPIVDTDIHLQATVRQMLSLTVANFPATKIPIATALLNINV